MEHMTKSEAHPYHRGRGVKVYDHSCPKCREGVDETTYVGWSLHIESLRALARRYETLAEAYSSMMATAGDHDMRCVREGQWKAMREAAEIARRHVADAEGA